MRRESTSSSTVHSPESAFRAAHDRALAFRHHADALEQIARTDSPEPPLSTCAGIEPLTEPAKLRGGRRVDTMCKQGYARASRQPPLRSSLAPATLTLEPCASNRTPRLPRIARRQRQRANLTDSALHAAGIEARNRRQL